MLLEEMGGRRSAGRAVEVSPRARIKKGRVGGGREGEETAAKEGGRERALNSKCNKKEGGRGREGVTH